MDDLQDLELLTVEQLIEIIQEKTGAGVNLSFTGKQQARRISRLVRPRVQRRIAGLSEGTSEEQSANLLLEGDNLQALASLYRWRGHVDLIVTDPPYNTGNDFRYNDKWDDNPNDPGLGDFVSYEDPARHTKWMKFMYPRLQMMHSMLKQSGVLAICIDHRELFHLGQMLDELFGEKNRLAIINWQKAYAPKSHDGNVSTATEYVLVYARDAEYVKTGLLERGASTDAKYRNPDNDPQGLWRVDNATAMGASTHAGQVYGIQNPFTGEIQYPPEGRCWAASRARMKKWLEEWGSTYQTVDIRDHAPSHALVLKGMKQDATTDADVLERARIAAEKVRDNEVWPELWFGKEGQGRPNRKRYLEKVKKGIVPMTYWADVDFDAMPEELGSVSWEHETVGHSQTGIRELDAVVGKGHGFETVKPLMLMQQIIQLWCPPEGLLMDPFAGSGTTGHAVLSLNETTGADRRFILIEQGRPLRGDSYARTLTAERLRRAITGRWANGKGQPLGGGFAFKTLTKTVDAKAVLRMERDEMVDTVIASHHDSGRRRGTSLVTYEESNYQYLVARNADGHGFYLVWDGPDGNTDLTEDVYEACVAEGNRAKLEPVYNVYARYNLFGTEDVRFYRIPDQILIDFGLDMRTEAYTDRGAEQ
jgi:adenine-specific DNA-methyltransferase